MSSRLEDELRDLYRTVTGPIRDEDLPGLYAERPRPRGRKRSSVFAPLAAGAAVVAAIGLGVSVAKLVSAPSQAPAAAGMPATRAETPPFVIVLSEPDSRGIQRLTVVDAKTGRTAGTVPDPLTGTTWSEVALARNGRTLILATAALTPSGCAAHLYTLTLSASGVPTAPVPWTDPVIPESIDAMAASADGRTLAFVSRQCGNGDPVIGVIRGDAMKAWVAPYPLNAHSLSLSADGRLIGYASGGPGNPARAQARLLDASASPGNAIAASKVLFTYPPGALLPTMALGRDGETAYFLWAAVGPNATLTGYRIGPGGPRGEIFHDTLLSARQLAWAGNRLVVSQGLAVYLVDPATGAATRVRAPWTHDREIFW